jgi:hypothetical protein
VELARLPPPRVADLCRPGERRWRGRLAELATSVGARELDSPLLIGVGQVFACAAIAIAEIDSTGACDDPRLRSHRSQIVSNRSRQAKIR